MILCPEVYGETDMGRYYGLDHRLRVVDAIDVSMRRGQRRPGFWLGYRRRSPGTAGGAFATLMYLPLYSPDFNPIEMVFSKLKALLRNAAARTVNNLWDAIAQAIEAFNPKECQNYFAAAGYDPA